MSDRILVVDDSEDVADALVRLLRTLGYEAEAVYDGQSALKQASEFQPDMAFIDIGMPGLNGYEVVQRIRQQPKNVHAILVALTGWSRPSDKKRAYESGFDLHVTKPMTIGMLNDLLALLDPSANLSGAPEIQQYRIPCDTE